MNWIITGGAGSGKSSLSKILGQVMPRELHVIFSCDAAARKLWTCVRFQDQIRKEFSNEIAEHDIADVSPSAMRGLFFCDCGARRRLEKIIHPQIFALLEENMHQTQRQGIAKVFLAEVPLYYETQWSMPADTVIVVAASQAVQRSRLIEHRFLGVEIVEGMLSAQLSLELKINKADVVVWNDGSYAMLETQAHLFLRNSWEY